MLMVTSVPTKAPPRPARGVPAPSKLVAVAVHDIEPATFERCALMRDWLDDHGISRVTLLVIPARDLHPAWQRSPQMVEWLAERRRCGDAIAQHGFQHVRAGGAPWSRPDLWSPRRRRGAEFVGLDDGETRRAVGAGWRLLKLAGLEPTGFVAPAYAYTPALRETIASRFRWWADLWRLHGQAGLAPGAAGPLAPAVGIGSPRAPMRFVSPLLVRAAALLSGRLLRIDLYPGDVRYPGHMLALERVLRAAGERRTAVSYDDLLTVR